MLIRLDDLSGPEIRALLEEHLQSMHELSPPESVHALDLTGLRKPGITFWTAWSRDELLGCGALKELDPAHGEIRRAKTELARQYERFHVEGEPVHRGAGKNLSMRFQSLVRKLMPAVSIHAALLRKCLGRGRTYL